MCLPQSNERFHCQVSAFTVRDSSDTIIRLCRSNWRKGTNGMRAGCTSNLRYQHQPRLRVRCYVEKERERDWVTWEVTKMKCRKDK